MPTGLDGLVGAGGTTRRETLLSAVDGLDPKIGGGTPLYDAVLAGYREAQADFAYGRLNALIVITDGRNEDAQSVSLGRLLDDLRLQFDGVRPVRIIAIGYGGAGRHREPAPDHRHHRWPYLRGADRGRGREGLRPGAGGPVGGARNHPVDRDSPTFVGVATHANVQERHHSWQFP